MKFSEYPFMRYALFFVLGVLAYPRLDFLGLKEILLITGLLFGGYIILSATNATSQSYRFRAFFPITAYALLMSMGLVFTHLRDVTNDPLHLIHHGEIEGYIGIVNDLDQEKPNTFANRIAVTAIKKAGKLQRASGEVIIYHKLSEALYPGDFVWIAGNPTPVPPPSNPQEFDYHRFLANQQIYHTHFVDRHVVKLGKENHAPINNWMLNLRSLLQGQMDKYITTSHSNQIAKALLIGQNKYLDKEVSEAYVTAGTMHVLAVSGLHVGIVYGFFFFFMKPYQLSGQKRVLYLSLIICIIWLYALITGLAPSVLRAASMFTLLAMAQMKSRNPSIYNSLALSALILMVFDPYIIFSVGFQLSYTAVFGIVLLQPQLSQRWRPRWKIANYLWELTTVSIAAQLATFPISVHYFHVFPTYFLFSNLAAIPGAFLIMSFGIPFMLLSFLAPIGSLLGKAVDLLISIENRVIFFFQKLPFARIEYIDLSFWEMILIWALIISAYLLAINNRRKYAYSCLFLFSCLIANQWMLLREILSRNELYIYRLENKIIVDHFYRGTLYSKDNTALPQDLNYKILPNRISKGQVQAVDLKEVESGNGRHIFLPGGAWLHINEDSFEIEASAIKQIVQYHNPKWLPIEEADVAQEAALRVIMQ